MEQLETTEQELEVANSLVEEVSVFVRCLAPHGCLRPCDYFSFWMPVVNSEKACSNPLKSDYPTRIETISLLRTVCRSWRRRIRFCPLWGAPVSYDDGTPVVLLSAYTMSIFCECVYRCSCAGVTQQVMLKYIEDVDQKLAALRSEHLALQNQYEEAESSLSSVRESDRRNAEKLRSACSRVEEQESKLQIVDKERKALEMELRRTKNELADTEQQLSEMDAVQTQLLDAVDKATKESAQIQAELEGYKKLQGRMEEDHFALEGSCWLAMRCSVVCGS